LAGAAQLLDFAVERVLDGNDTPPLPFTLRLNIYSQESYGEQPEGPSDGGQNPQLLYGERLKFPVKLRQPRNYKNPGAFEERSSSPSGLSCCSCLVPRFC
jgi:hypothetical protein